MDESIGWVLSDSQSRLGNDTVNMDPLLGPPTQSPDDYSARERRERTGVAVGISLGVFFLFAGPLCLLYYIDWRRRRRRRARRQDLCDLEGTTAVSRSEKGGTTRFERTGASTLTTTVVAREDAALTEEEIAEWRRHQLVGAETDLERLKRDPTSPLNVYLRPKDTEPLSADQVLGLDKRSYLQNLPVASSPSSATEGTSSITVLPSRLPVYRRTLSRSDSSTAIPESSNTEECVSPWAVEHAPNPVIFKHLLGPSGETLGHVGAPAEGQNGEASTHGGIRSDHAMEIEGM